VGKNKKKKGAFNKHVIAVSVVTIMDSKPVLMVTWEDGMGNIYHNEYDINEGYTTESIMAMLKLYGFN